jgi:hypothetical protein
VFPLRIYAVRSVSEANIAIILAVVALLAVLYVLSPNINQRTDFRDTLIAVMAPLLLTFIAIIIFEIIGRM